MESPRRSNNRFPFGYVIAGVVAVGILAALAVPQWTGCISCGINSQSLNNAKQIYLATSRMALDDSVSPDPKLGWPGELPDVKDMGDFGERLVEYEYFERGDLKSTFYAPGVQPYSGSGRFSSENSGFKLYQVTKEDVGQVIFMATKNFTFGAPLDPKSTLGKKGAVIVRKGGEGLIISDAQATTSADGALGLMPGSTSRDSPGSERDVLK